MLRNNVFKYILIMAVITLYADVVSGETAKVKSDANNPRNNANIYRDIEYARTGDISLLLDIYVPKTAKKPVPVIIWIHGGGWRNGSKGGAIPVTLGFLERGYAIASIDYRLTDKASFPAQIYDCKAAVRFLRGNAAKYGLDPKHFGTMGISAGGHLSALLGVTSDGKVLEGNEGNYLNESSAIQAVCDFCGPIDLVTIAKGNSAVSKPDSFWSKFVGGPVSEHLDVAAKASPITYVSKKSPPFFIAHGTEDKAIPVAQSETFYEALKKAGVPAELRILPGVPHGGPAFRDPNLIGDVKKFFDKNLK